MKNNSAASGTDGADRRSVATDALDTLGTFPIPEGSGRDAIHLAVEPVVAGEVICPNDDILVKDGVAYKPRHGEKALGKADPFAPKFIPKGTRFWLVIYPRQITSLRHVWSHPDFPDSPAAAIPMTPEEIEKSESEAWLHAYAATLGVDYGGLVDAAYSFLDFGDYMIEGGKFEGISTHPDFWRHYSIATGRQVTNEEARSFFSCSC